MADGNGNKAGGRCSSHGRRSHFLVVAYGYQGHLNPARALARRLARVHGAAARVTLSVTVSAHARMFPSSSDCEVEDEVSDGLISYVPYSDGFGFGFAARPRSADERARCRRESVTSLSAVVRRLAVAGRPVTCVVSAFFLPAADVAVEHGIPLAVFWSQSATTLAAYYHYFHGYEQLVAAHVDDPTYEVRLPGLPPLQIRNLPSFLVDATGSEHSKASVEWMRTLLELIAREKPKVLVNTTDITEEEATALQAMKQHLDVFAVGPMVTPSPATTTRNGCSRGDDRIIHLYEQDQKKGMYIKEWLDAQRDRSVVYISFGSMLGYDNRQQVEEILQGLCECGRPYLWVVPKDGRGEQVERCLLMLDDDGNNNNSGRQAAGMVVEWCEQLEVLSHSSTGCFVTHCGWNSTLEALLLGVPMVAVPDRYDQALNAHLVEEWGVGVRAERDATTGLLLGTELANCIEVVIGDGDEAAKIRERAEALKDKLRKEVIESDLVEFSLQNFVTAMQKQT